MLVTNSNYKFSDAALKKKESSFTASMVGAFEYGLNKLIAVGKHQADSPLLSIELAMCVAQCMGKRYLVAVQAADLA